jgi:hypothetical protein
VPPVGQSPGNGAPGERHEARAQPGYPSPPPRS